MRRVLAGLGALVLALGAYVTADIFDLAPGVLTTVPPSTRMPAVPTATGGPAVPEPFIAAPIPSTAASAAAPLALTDETSPIPSKAGLTAALARALADSGLGSSVGVTVRDGRTGAHLLDVSADVPRVPASTVKLLTATAIVSTLDPAMTFSTRAVRGATAGRVTDVILVAGGDTLLSPGKGKPTAVAGRAGLADLAEKTVRTLKAQGVSSIRLHLDDRYAKGPSYAPGWRTADIDFGLTGPVAMLGLSTQRPVRGTAAPDDPASSTARAFRSLLAARGLTVARGIGRLTAPEGAPDLGVVRSAPLTDVLALALAESDNALTESLARQGANEGGARTSFAAVTAWVKKTLGAKGVDVKGVTLVDTSGLSGGTLVPARALGDVLALAAGGQDRALLEVVAQLPVAGLSGTLAERFRKGSAHAAAGVARAKTGTLTGASGLAGTVVDRDGRLLTFAILADRIPSDAGTLNARAALDRFVATLASCGCG